MSVLPDERLATMVSSLVCHHGYGGTVSQVILIDTQYRFNRYVITNDLDEKRVRNARQRLLDAKHLLASIGLGHQVGDLGSEAVVEYVPDQEFYGLHLPPPPPCVWAERGPGDFADSVWSFREDLGFEEPEDFDKWREGEPWKY